MNKPSIAWPLNVMAFCAMMGLVVNGCLHTSDEEFDGELAQDRVLVPDAGPGPGTELGKFCSQLAELVCPEPGESKYDKCIAEISSMSEKLCEDWVEYYYKYYDYDA